MPKLNGVEVEVRAAEKVRGMSQGDTWPLCRWWAVMLPGLSEGDREP